MADIFISHSSGDNEIAAAIGERIRSDRPSWSLFYDKDNIRAGQRWQERLREELTSCRVVLALLSRNWLGSPWCFTEAVTATFRGKDVVGIETEELTGDDLARAPPILHERQRVRLRDGDDRAWREILEALDRSGLDPDDWFPIPPNVGPYPGLVAFDEKDAGVFFGRKQEITEYLSILDTLRGSDRSQVLVISGASGSGKSSLLRAGLIPRLRRKHDWVVISPFEVAREPVRDLLDRLGETLAGLGLLTQGIDFTKPPGDPAALARTLDETLRGLEQATGAWVLLPLDQAEAMLAGDRRAGDPAKLLLDALAQLLGRRTRHVVVVAAIRTEFVPRLEAVFAGSEVRLRQAPLSAIGSLAEVIEKPADRFGIELEPGLSEQIVADVRSADALPLLAYTLKELNDRGGGDRCLTLEEYRSLGGVQGAIAAKLETVLSDPEPTEEESRALRRAFTRYLIRVDEGAVAGERLLRRVVPRASLPQSADRVLRRLIDAGLLTTKDGTIELAHERLIDDWRKLPLKTWLVQDAAERRLIDQLRQRVTDDTLPDGLLAQAEELLHRDHGLATEEPGLAALVQRSQDRKRARERRRWIVLGVISIAAIGFLGLALWALSQRSEAIAAKIVAQERLDAIQTSLQAMLSKYIDYINAVGFKTNAIPINIDEKVINAWYDGKDIFINPRLSGDVDVPRREYTQHVLSENTLSKVDSQNQIKQHIESALADYFTCSFADRPIFGEIVAAVFNLPRPYVRNLNNSRRFDEAPDLRGSVTLDRGEIWGGAFWEVRSVLGRDLADRLLARAWQSMAWPIAEQGTALKFIEVLLLNAKEIASDQQVTNINAIFRKRGFPTPA
jgi:hypothetical protein